MVSERKKPYPVDKSAFTPEQEAIDKAEEAQAKVKKVRKSKAKLTLEQLLLAAKELGVSIYIPTSKEEELKQEQSLAKLGFITEQKKEVEENLTELKGYLYGQHIINGVTYGPGNFTLPFTETALYSSLLKQDQMAMTALRDTTDYSSSNRCFIIGLGKGKDSFNKYRKIEVAPENFNTAMQQIEAVRAGAMDIAGYNNSVFENNSF
jgi:hypothetical protein